MPTVSECQTFIQEILHDVNMLQLSDSSQTESKSESLESTSTSSSTSSSESESSSSSSSESSSGSEKFMSVDDADTDEERIITMGMTADLLQVITETRILNPHLVAKCSQLDLILINFKLHDPKHFRSNLVRVSAGTFDSLLVIIDTHSIFLNNANISQIPVSKQLAIAMFRFGHNGNTASVEAVAQWAGVSAGTVVNCTCRVIIAFLALHDSAVRWPSEDEKEELKQWVEGVSCYTWWDGYCMVDGTPVVLFQKPGYHGEALLRMTNIMRII